MAIRTWIPPVVVAALGIGLLAVSAGRADDKKPADPPAAQPADPTDAAPAAPADEGEMAGADVFEAIKDLGFVRFIDVEHIGAAWHDLDASLMTDLALQLAEGERVLMRTHKSGVTAQKMFGLALKVAVEKKDKTGLDRLGQVAAARKDDALTAKIEAAKKVIGAARAVDPAARLSVEDVTPEQFAATREVIDRITRSKLAGDKEGLKELAAELDGAAGLPAAQAGYLRKLIDDAGETGRGDDDGEGMTDVLRQLSAASRGNESNRDEGRARVAAGGWTVLWGVNINEAEYLKFIAAVASAASSGNPAAIQQYISNYADRTWVKVKDAFPGAVKSTVMSFIVRAIKSGGSEAKFGRVGVKAGIATYQRWYYVSAQVPDGVKWQGLKSTVKYKTIQKKIPLPNHHTPYVAFRI